MCSVCLHQQLVVTVLITVCGLCFLFFAVLAIIFQRILLIFAVLLLLLLGLLTAFLRRRCDDMDDCL